MIYGLLGGLLISISSISNATDDKKPLKIQQAVADDGAENAEQSQTDKVDIFNRPIITGQWAMTVPGINCTEYYNFLENGNFVVKSADEWTAGVYGYQPAEQGENTAPVIAMRVQYDNLKKDCAGRMDDARGQEFQHYVTWLNDSSMAFCATAEGKQCFATLKKILP